MHPSSCHLTRGVVIYTDVCSSREEVKEVFDTPLMELVYKAATVHRMYHDPRQARVTNAEPVGRGRRLTRQCALASQVQQCTLMSIKTGGCPEDCGYCSQSSKHKEGTGMKATKLADFDEVYEVSASALSVVFTSTNIGRFIQSGGCEGRLRTSYLRVRQLQASAGCTICVIAS